MSTSEIKETIGALPVVEQAELAAWLLRQCEPPAPAESEAVIEDLKRPRRPSRQCFLLHAEHGAVIFLP